MRDGRREREPRRESAGGSQGKHLLFDLSGIDLNRIIVSRQALEAINPHRGCMALLDGIVWENPEHTRGVAVKKVRSDEFWVEGHFPSRPMLPGVLMIEAGAQLAVYLYNIRFAEPGLAAFTRIEDAVFRSPVEPGQTLYLLCEEMRFGPRRFVSNIQGVVDDRIAFEASITGMRVALPTEMRGE